MGFKGPDGAVSKLSANGLVGTGFVSRYRHVPRVGFKGPDGAVSKLSANGLVGTEFGIYINRKEGRKCFI